ncbi:MAG: 50S ribosomal protein L4 [Chitinophagaceae bacterium]|nr:50S ribosomal protein L4 [Chitinophagaceae bacterium]
MKLDVLNIEGKPTGRQVELPDDWFGIKPHSHILYLSVKQYLAAQRQGTHKVKSRSEVKGSTRKLHRQKGTGGSRKGGIRNPLYRGGGSIFGPQPRDYDLKMNHKEKILARKSALSVKAAENSVMVVEDFSPEVPKTKFASGVFRNLKIENKKILFIQAERNQNLELSVRNLPKVKHVNLNNINTYDILNADVLLFTESAAGQFQKEKMVV